jgi:hypothetical protein|nr:MAG TPA: hypothetical protein [Caudoviricetes sp.]
MDSQLSLGDVTKSVFTPDFSSTYKSLSADSTLCNMLTTNTIKQSISVDSSNKSEIKDSEYKIKEAEKIISKNILFDIYNFNISSKYSTYSSYLGKNIHTYDYTNLDNPEVPSFKKLNLYLDQIGIILDNHSSIVASKDTGNQLYSSLQEFITEIKSSTENIYSIVMANRISNVTDDDFIINAEKLFKGESSFKTKKFTGDKQNIASYFNSVKGKYLEIAKSVAGYNEGLQKTLIKFNSVMNKLATQYKSNYSQVAMQVEYKKEELRNVLYTFAMKYLNIANILYSIKAECIKEYLQPSYSDYDELITMKEDNSLDEYYDDDDFFNESTDAFDDDEVISGDDKQVDFSYRTIELEEAFFAYTIKPLLENNDRSRNLDKVRQMSEPTGTSEPDPQEQNQQQGGNAGNGGVTKDGNAGKTGTANDPADAGKTVTGSKDNPASTDTNQSKIAKFGDKLKELWNKITAFIKNLMDKISFSVNKSRDRLFGIINDFDSVKKINENLNNSDDAYTFRVYNGNVDLTNKRINAIKLDPIDRIVNINNADDIKNFNADKSKQNFIETINKMNDDLSTYFRPHSEGQAMPNETNGYYSSADAIIVLKNYFAGNDTNAVKTAFNDIKNNTEGKAKNNILATTINIATIKSTSANTIINNIKTIRIDQLRAQCNNLTTNGTNYVNKLATFFDKPNAQAEAAKVTIESVMAEYFGDIVQEADTGTTDNTEQGGNTDSSDNSINAVTKLLSDYINKYAVPISKCANYAYQQMCDNYYNIFNALLAGPLKVGEANNNQNGNNQAGNGNQQAGDNAGTEQPAGGNGGNNNQNGNNNNQTGNGGNPQ